MTDNQTNSNYQDILDKYAQSINANNDSQIPQEKIKPEPEPEAINPPEPILTSEEETLLKSQAPQIDEDVLLSSPESMLLPEDKSDTQSIDKSESSPILNPPPEISVSPQNEPEPVLNPPQIDTSPVPEAIASPDTSKAIIPPPPQIELPPELQNDSPLPKKENHFFKYLFFLSLFIFIIVLILTIVSFINSQKNVTNSDLSPLPSEFPTDMPQSFCEINDQRYVVGESFPAADACNTCTCSEDLTIVCTENTCEASGSTIPTSISVDTRDWRLYTIPDEKLTIKYPTDWTLIPSTSNETFYTFTSPNKFNLMIRVGLDGLGGGCDEECQSHNIKSSVIDTLNFYSDPLYVVINGIKDNSEYGQPNIGFNVIPEKSCWANVCYGFKGKNTSGTVIINGSYPKYMSSEEFVNSADVKTAISILKTLSY